MILVSYKRYAINKFGSELVINDVHPEDCGRYSCYVGDQFMNQYDVTVKCR